MCNISMYKKYIFLFLKSNNNIIYLKHYILKYFLFEVLFKGHVKTT